MRSLTRYREITVDAEEYGLTFVIKMQRPKGAMALQLKGSGFELLGMSAEADDGKQPTPEEAARVMQDAAAGVAACIKHIKCRPLEDAEAELEELAFDEIQEGATWSTLDEDQQAEAVHTYPDVLLWPVFTEVTRGAIPSLVGKSSVPQKQTQQPDG